MGKINVLDFEIANLIAAGEVVERPSSVLKELIENSIDSGATRIVAEIKRGGVALIRVTDNGCGISREDLPVALKRHATSKIRSREDLESIMTLGFRGEALAAISSVARMTIITRTADSDIGHMLTSEGGAVLDLSEVGTSVGTTVITEDLFFNVPARRKFLKKDSTEAMNVTALVERVALSRPDIAIQLLIDGEERFSTPGNGKLYDTVYSVLGKDFASKLIEVDAEANGIRTHGFIGRSDNVRKNRNLQNFFINNRYVKSLTAMAAIEKAYTSYIAPEAFPTCVLFLEMNPTTVDVNVHPAKLEVKFANEQPVFEAIYHSVREALESHEYRPEISLGARSRTEGDPRSAFVPIGADTRGSQISLGLSDSAKSDAYPTAGSAVFRGADITQRPSSVSYGGFGDRRVSSGTDFSSASSRFSKEPERPDAELSAQRSLELLKKYAKAEPTADYSPAAQPIAVSDPQSDHRAPSAPNVQNTDSPSPVDYRIIGEAFDCYIFVEVDSSLLIIDKHAAHERIIFEQLKSAALSEGGVASQALMLPIPVILTPEEQSALFEHKSEICACGFEYELSDLRADVTAIPDAVDTDDAESLLLRMADDIVEGRGDPALTDALRREKALYQVACKAAIKGGRRYDPAITSWLVGRVMELPDVTVCPHGRPIAQRLTKSELDRRFERLK